MEVVLDMAIRFPTTFPTVLSTPLSTSRFACWRTGLTWAATSLSVFAIDETLSDPLEMGYSGPFGWISY
jgi:hypothetical protein